MAVWQIRAGRDASLADAFIDERRVCLGFSATVSLTEFASLDILRQWIGDKAPHEGPRAASSMWRLLQEVQVGDWVVMPSKPRGMEYAVGRIAGHYQFDPCLIAMHRDPHTRAVEWLKTGLPGERLADLRLPRRGTIARLRRDGVEARIEAISD